MADMNAEEQAKHKAALEAIAAQIGSQWHESETHKVYAAQIVLNLAGVKDKAKRLETVEAFRKMPLALGSNASGFAQQLGRPSKSAMEKKALKDI